MFIIVGLGNPGEKFKNTRHNVGFMVLDLFATENDFPEFEFSKKYNALVTEKDGVTLAKPQTFMNESGFSVKNLTTHYKLQTTNLVVIHDDIDIQIGKMKISKDSSSGGHKGVASIIQSIGRQDFTRFKIGICPENGKPEEVEKFVIKKFTQEEIDVISPIIHKSSEALAFLLGNDLDKTMNKFN